MTSFPVEYEPRPEPRLAAAALLLHLSAAAWPWVTRCPAWIGAPLSMFAILGFAATLARLPGAHCGLKAVSFRADGWSVRLDSESGDEPARIGPGTRVYAGLIALELIVGRERRGWLVTGAATDSTQFRRLKARLRLAC